MKFNATHCILPNGNSSFKVYAIADGKVSTLSTRNDWGTKDEAELAAHKFLNDMKDAYGHNDLVHYTFTKHGIIIDSVLESIQ